MLRRAAISTDDANRNYQGHQESTWKAEQHNAGFDQHDGHKVHQEVRDDESRVNEINESRMVDLDSRSNDPRFLRVSAAIRAAAAALPGIPSASVGSMEPPTLALLATSAQTMAS